MAEFVTPTTRIEAVNSILASIGEAPTNSVDEPSRTAVIQAIACLNEVSRSLQGQGWFWNREREVELEVDGDLELVLATNVLTARVSDVALDWITREYVYRNGKIYNRKDRTYEFSSGYTLKVDQIVLLPFEELPENARYYVWARAGNIFQGRHLPGDALYRFTAAQASVAYAAMLNEDTEVERYNLDESGAMRDLVFRR